MKTFMQLVILLLSLFWVCFELTRRNCGKVDRRLKANVSRSHLESIFAPCLVRVQHTWRLLHTDWGKIYWFWRLLSKLSCLISGAKHNQSWWLNPHVLLCFKISKNLKSSKWYTIYWLNYRVYWFKISIMSKRKKRKVSIVNARM